MGSPTQAALLLGDWIGARLLQRLVRQQGVSYRPSDSARPVEPELELRDQVFFSSRETTRTDDWVENLRAGRLERGAIGIVFCVRAEEGTQLADQRIFVVVSTCHCCLTDLRFSCAQQR